MLKVGDTVYVANPDKEYENKCGVREHKSFFGEVTQITSFQTRNAVKVRFHKTSIFSRKAEWWYGENELALASDLKKLTLEEISSRFGVTIKIEDLKLN